MSYQSRLYCSAVAEGRLLAERYKSFHHMTACACSSWFTQITFIPIIWVATEHDRLHIPLYLPQKSLIGNHARLRLGKNVSGEKSRIHGNARHRIYETNGVSYNEIIPSAQANHLMARNKPRDRIAIRRRRDLRLIEGNEIVVAKPALGHRKSKIQSVVDRLFEIHVDTIRAAK
jgi:hypothetical protein